MSDIQQVNSSTPTPKPTEALPISNSTKKPETTEDKTVEPSISNDPKRDEEIQKAFMNAPPDGASSTTPATPTESIPTGDSPPIADEETEEAFQTSSQGLDDIYNSSYVQSNDALKTSMEENTSQYESNLSISKTIHKASKASKEQTEDNIEQSLDAGKPPEAGDDTKSSKNS